jgi:hypothetical protein
MTGIAATGRGVESPESTMPLEDEDGADPTDPAAPTGPGAKMEGPPPLSAWMDARYLGRRGFGDTSRSGCCSEDTSAGTEIAENDSAIDPRRTMETPILRRVMCFLSFFF